LAWDELEGLKVAAPYSVKTLPARLKALKSDPWEGFFSTRQSITAKAKKAVRIRPPDAAPWAFFIQETELQREPSSFISDRKGYIQ